MEFRFELINDKNHLSFYKQPILKLFERSFGKKLNPKMWGWAYIDNVCGNPVVALAFDGLHLAGHYAVIPIALRKGNEVLKACLSMTTMVDNDYRGKGLFVTLAEKVYEQLIFLNYDMVVGYPNQNSAHGFKKYLKWELEEPSEIIVSVTKEILNNSHDLNNFVLQKDFIQLDMENKEFLQWRLSKPDHQYTQFGKTVVKKFQDSFDIVYLGDDYMQELADRYKYNLLIDKQISDLMNYKTIEYRYGYRHFNDDIKNLNFKKDLLISDIF
jgi:hypothetical protein